MRSRKTGSPRAHPVIGQPKKRGRPSKFDVAMVQRICKLVSVGVPIRVACEAEGIGKETLRRWRDAGDAGQEPFIALVDQFRQALAKCETAVTMHVVSAAQRDWRAGAWWLERRRPGMYGPPKQTLRTEKAPADMTTEELEAAIAQFGYVRAAEGEKNKGPG